MRGLALAALAIAMAATASGCLRNKFDLCAQANPDPQCAFLDAGDAASVDAATTDAATTDAATTDAATTDAALGD